MLAVVSRGGLIPGPWKNAQVQGQQQPHCSSAAGESGVAFNGSSRRQMLGSVHFSSRWRLWVAEPDLRVLVSAQWPLCWGWWSHSQWLML